MFLAAVLPSLIASAELLVAGRSMRGLTNGGLIWILGSKKLIRVKHGRAMRRSSAMSRLTVEREVQEGS